MTKNTIIGFFLAIFLAFGLGFSVNSCGKNSDGAFIDTAKARIDTIYDTTYDTIIKDGKLKLRIDSFYYEETTYITINYNDTLKMKALFDSMYVKNDTDTVITTIHHSQMVKTIDMGYKFNRDSSKLWLTEHQLSACTTGLNKTKMACDSALDSAKKVIVSDNGVDKKTLTIGGLIILILGVFAGTQL